MGEERCRIVSEEVAMLTVVVFIQEIDYSTWLSNVIMVKKPNGK